MTTRTYTLEDLALCRQVTSLDLAFARAHQQLTTAKALDETPTADAFTIEYLKVDVDLRTAVLAVKRAGLADGCFTVDGIINRCYLIVRDQT